MTDMTDVIDLFESNIAIDDEQIVFIRELVDGLFRGHIEPLLLGSCIGILTLERGVSCDQLTNALPHSLDALPWEGCERRIMSILVNKMLQRGKSEDKIREVVSVFASIIKQMDQLLISGGIGADPIAQA